MSYTRATRQYTAPYPANEYSLLCPGYHLPADLCRAKSVLAWSPTGTRNLTFIRVDLLYWWSILVGVVWIGQSFWIGKDCFLLYTKLAIPPVAVAGFRAMPRAVGL